jgi:hypothetical protein
MWQTKNEKTSCYQELGLLVAVLAVTHSGKDVNRVAQKSCYFLYYVNRQCNIIGLTSLALPKFWPLGPTRSGLAGCWSHFGKKINFVV